MRKRKLLWLLAIGLVLVLAAIRLRWTPTDHVTKENHERLRYGMSPAEVEAILGPPGNYATGPVDVPGFQGGGGGFYDVWAGDTLVIYIHYEDSRASIIGSAPSRRRDYFSSDILLWRLRRPFSKWLPEQKVRE